MNRAHRDSVLYISYDGLCDPLGQSQVLPYVLALADRSWRMTIMSYEKPEATPEARASIAKRLEAKNVGWIAKRYHKTPTVPATAFDIANGTLHSIANMMHRRLLCVHARSYVSATAALTLKRVFNVPLVFDIRGFWADEKIEGGSWNKGGLYRSAKAMEQVLFGAADAVVSLTHSGRRELERWPNVGGRGVPISVIPTCTDLRAYDGYAESERQGPLTIGYLGSLGGPYLIDETVAVFREIRRLAPDARFHVITPREQDPLLRALARYEIPESCVTVEALSHHDVPSRLAKMHATISLRKPGYSTLATFPTKFGESLAAGTPVVVNPGIGDCAEIVDKERIGVIADLPNARHAETARNLLAVIDEGVAMRKRCYQVAKNLLSLELAVEEYSRIYSRLRDRRS